MSETAEGYEVLAIDDDNVSQRMIRRALTGGGFKIRAASNGHDGIDEAMRQLPDMILLDVEMPGMNGYEVCAILRSRPATANVPIVFLSSHGTLRDRMQGYESGADDFVVKPFEPQFLLARINVLMKYRDDRRCLEERYSSAQKTALVAMTENSDLGLVLKFVERSYSFRTFDELAEGMFALTNQLQLECSLMMAVGDQLHWSSSDGSISPLEKELIEMADKDKRFFDFGPRTIVNYPHLSLLVKNMPLEDLERYGRIKDLLPSLASTINAKISTLNIEQALLEQSRELLQLFRAIRSRLYHLAKEMIDNQEISEEVLRGMVHELNYDLLRMGLDDDQEAYLLQRIDRAIEEAMVRIDIKDKIHDAFLLVLTSLKEVMTKQQAIVDSYALSQVRVEHLSDNYEGDIELF